MTEFIAHYAGPLAGLATSALWTLTAISFTNAGRKIGATNVNALRLLLAIILLSTTHRLYSGTWWPSAESGQLWYLALSGVIGLAIGDQALFSSFMSIGQRLAMLIMTTSPLMAAILGWVALGERISLLGLMGMFTTLAGVGWVIAERPQQPQAGPKIDQAQRMRGVLYATLGAACQAAGLLLSKKGIGHGWLPSDAHLGPQAATLVRMTFAGFGVLPILALVRYRQRQIPKQLRPKRTPRMILSGLALTLAGSIVGPYLGVWMNLTAINLTELGKAQTLCSLMPIFILPLAVWVEGEKLTARAIAGAFVAVGGAGILFMTAGGA
jgi:drug/metabolite transporter (DMT)-like permease